MVTTRFVTTSADLPHRPLRPHLPLHGKILGTECIEQCTIIALFTLFSLSCIQFLITWGAQNSFGVTAETPFRPSLACGRYNSSIGRRVSSGASFTSKHNSIHCFKLCLLVKLRCRSMHWYLGAHCYKIMPNHSTSLEET